MFSFVRKASDKIPILWGDLFLDRLLGEKQRRAQTHLDLLNVKTVFLITPGRSGTKSLVKWCAKNTEMLCYHAPKPWLATIGYLFHRKLISSDAARYAFYVSREKYLKQAFEYNKVLLDGDCKNLPLLKEISDLMPNSSFIHLVRNPESFVKSGISRGYYKDVPSQIWGHLEERVGNAAISFKRQVEKIAWFWNEANKIAESIKAEVGPKRAVTIVSDKMFMRPKIIAEALDVLGLQKEIGFNPNVKLKKSNSQRKPLRFSAKELEVIRNIINSICDTRDCYFKES
jgi:hypothetical protein